MVCAGGLSADNPRTQQGTTLETVLCISHGTNKVSVKEFGLFPQFF